MATPDPVNPDGEQPTVEQDPDVPQAEDAEPSPAEQAQAQPPYPT